MIFFRKSEEEAPKISQELRDLREAAPKARLPELVAKVNVGGIIRQPSGGPIV